MACLAGAVAFSLSCGSFIPIVSAKQLVFIHYCNNTAPAGQDGENHRVTIERLEGIGHEKAQSIADNLREEPALMAEAIAADREVLRKELPGRLGVVLCELDNENARAGQLKVWIPGQAESQQLSTDIPAIGDYVFDGNPLATAAGLKACLLAIADRFPPDAHEFVLVTQSHGSDELALTVKLARKHEEISMEDFAAMFRGELITYDLPSVGVSKAAYFDVLGQVGTETGMQFPLVILETCKGTFDIALAEELPPNTELFFSSGKRCLEFRSLPYEDVFAATETPEELINQMDTHLRPNFLRIERVDRLPIWIWSLPLIAVFMFQLLQRFRRDSKSCGQD